MHDDSIEPIPLDPKSIDWDMERDASPSPRRSPSRTQRHSTGVGRAALRRSATRLIGVGVLVGTLVGGCLGYMLGSRRAPQPIEAPMESEKPKQPTPRTDSLTQELERLQVATRAGVKHDNFDALFRGVALAHQQWKRSDERKTLPQPIRSALMGAFVDAEYISTLWNLKMARALDRPVDYKVLLGCVTLEVLARYGIDKDPLANHRDKLADITEANASYIGMALRMVLDDESEGMIRAAMAHFSVQVDVAVGRLTE